MNSERSAAIAEARELLDRAACDLEHGWPEAALDAIGRAHRVLRQPWVAQDTGEIPRDAAPLELNSTTHPMGPQDFAPDARAMPRGTL